MPTASFAYPSEDGHQAVSLENLHRYCAQRKLSQQAALQKAIELYFAGRRTDDGHLFPVAAFRREGLAPQNGQPLKKLEALFESFGLSIEKPAPVLCNARIDVEFPEQEEVGSCTLPRFLEQCEFIDEPPQQVIQHAVWQLVTRF
ncbi:hypothetical protein [Gulbenkiania mobilis]|uniref:hypothetical protein n=1 Tax=Gulbenkiania mobilis TaxID=397457 RepID=UPI0006BBF7B4|nr:hypothetical protein [Gulbenkiania mobilis]